MKNDRDYLSIKLLNGGKQSKLTFNITKSLPGVGAVKNMVTETVRTPVNALVRGGISSLGSHLLRLSGYWNQMHDHCWDEEKSKFKDLKDSTGIVSSAAVAYEWGLLLKNLDVDYVYYSNGRINLGGTLSTCDNGVSLKLSISDIDESVGYEHHETLLRAVQDLFVDIDVWYNTITETTKKQLSMDFVAIDRKISAKDAETILESMSIEDQSFILDKHLAKHCAFLAAELEDMTGIDEDGDKDVKNEDAPKEKKEKKEKKQKLEKSPRIKSSVKADPKTVIGYPKKADKKAMVKSDVRDHTPLTFGDATHLIEEKKYDVETSENEFESFLETKEGVGEESEAFLKVKTARKVLVAEPDDAFTFGDGN